MSEHAPEFTDSAASYVLRALPPEEVAGFEAHLATCAECRSEVQRLQPVADALPSSPDQLAAPPELKDRIMSVVHAEANLLQAAGPQADVPARRTPADATGERRRRFGLSWFGRPGLALATALVALVLGGAAGAALFGGGNSARTVTAQTVPQGASAKLLVRDQGGHSTLVTRRLPTPGSGRVYQVWLQRGNGAPIPTNALFGTSRNGSASVDVPGSLKDVDRVLVSSEPVGGSRAPTRTPLISVPTA